MGKKVQLGSNRPPDIPLNDNEKIIRAINGVGIEVANFNKELASKLNKVTEYINNRPSSFEFSIIRDSQGYIDKVIVKPIKE